MISKIIDEYRDKFRLNLKLNPKGDAFQNRTKFNL